MVAIFCQTILFSSNMFWLSFGFQAYGLTRYLQTLPHVFSFEQPTPLRNVCQENTSLFALASVFWSTRRPWSALRSSDSTVSLLLSIFRVLRNCQRRSPISTALESEPKFSTVALAVTLFFALEAAAVWFLSFWRLFRKIDPSYFSIWRGYFEGVRRTSASSTLPLTTRDTHTHTSALSTLSTRVRAQHARSFFYLFSLPATPFSWFGEIQSSPVWLRSNVFPTWSPLLVASNKFSFVH